MSVKKIYTCNICGERIDTLNYSFGVHFQNLKKFTLGGYACTDGIHICYSCAIQLRENLNNPEIEKAMAIEDTP